jgi:hypothetical protein
MIKYKLEFAYADPNSEAKFVFSTLKILTEHNFCNYSNLLNPGKSLKKYLN